MKCEYGCEQEGTFKLRNGKYCCSERFNSCPEVRRKNSEKNKIVQSGSNNGMYGKKQTIESNRKNSESNKNVWKDKGSIFNTIEYRKKLKESLIKVGKNKRRTIEYINRKYPFFSKIEEMRYNPDKSGEKEIQVHCKNHQCPNSKDKGGWFTPTKTQIYERIRCIEQHNLDYSYFYCSDKCKEICPLYKSRGQDPFKEQTKLYSYDDYQTFRSFVLERDNYICQFCGEEATDVHHERPQKLEPVFALDPDYAWSCCEKCHYEKGHKKGSACSTGILSNIVCY
jgi:hypothetical protein